jgi:hypothetical protein
MRWQGIRWVLLVILVGVPSVNRADAPVQLLEHYASIAKDADAGFSGFSAERGRDFYVSKHPLRGVGMVSCASCHVDNPRQRIKAHRTEILCRACHVIIDEEHPNPKQAKKRYIEAFAPAANHKRFSDLTLVDKYFKLNCQMVLKRECTIIEKGDLIAWLLTVEGEALQPKTKEGEALDLLPSEE